MPRWTRTSDLSLFEAIRSYSDVSAKSFLVGSACFIGLVDVGCAVALYGVVHRWAPGAWWPLTIIKNTWDKEVCLLLLCYREHGRVMYIRDVFCHSLGRNVGVQPTTFFTIEIEFRVDVIRFRV